MLANCGAVYNSASVVEEATAVGAVDVVQITANSLTSANASEYSPKTLPAIFSQTAGTNGTALGAGALPKPAYGDAPRPTKAKLSLPPAYQPGPYRIGVGDVVLLATSQSGTTVSELTGLLAAQNRRQGYTVQDDGAIAIPDVGRVELGGMTVEEAEAKLFKALVEHQIDPAFSLEIAEFNSQRVAVGGAVRKPMIAPMTLTALPLNEALTQAGGLEKNSTGQGVIRIFRDGKLYQIPREIYAKRPDIQTLSLKPGDAVYVDTGYDLTRAQGYFEEQIRVSERRQEARESSLRQLTSEVGLRRAELQEARQNFETRQKLGALDRDYVYISGEVGAQGRYTLPYERKAVLADALFDQAQGVRNETGNIAEVYVLRGHKNSGGIQAWHLDATNAANLVLATRFELRPNDVVFVTEQPVTIWGRVIRQISPSLLAAAIANSGS